MEATVSTVCVYIYIYTHLYVYIYIYIYIYIHANHVDIYVTETPQNRHTQKQTCEHEETHPPTLTNTILANYAYPTHTHIHTYTHTHMHTYTHAHMHTYSHAHILTDTHTHTRMLTEDPPLPAAMKTRKSGWSYMNRSRSVADDVYAEAPEPHELLIA
jgi:hypothetical protein